MIKQALLGGSFDPIHSGHLHLAREILKSGLVDSVVFLPNARHNFKRDQVLLDFPQRYELVKDALEPGMEVWDDDASGSGYTSELLARLFNKYPDRKFYWVLGSDNLAKLRQWHDFQWLRVYVHFLIVPRPGYSAHDHLLVRLKRRTLKMEPCPISSTLVREKIKAGESISGLVPPHLEQRIIALYRPLLTDHGH